MRAAIVSIGSELIDGFVTDTNATFLAQELTGLGIELVEVMQVGDNLERLVRILQRAWDDGDLIITTGGIGPTEDDLTREGIAALLHETVNVDPELLSSVSAFFASRGIPMPEQNAKQAWLIPSAAALPNPMGTAPGWFVQRDGHAIVTMPGVPREMMRMWREQAVPRLLPALGDRAVVARTLKTIGIGESAAERQISSIIARGFPIVATYAKDDGVHVRITASAAATDEAAGAVEATTREILDILGEYVYGEDETSLGAAIFAPLVTSGRSLAISEAGAGGRTANLLAEEPTGIERFRGAVVRSFDEAAARYGTDTEAPDAPAEVARREAHSIRAALDADVGFAVAARLEPGESADKTVGTIALCLDLGDEPSLRRHQVMSIPSEIRRRAALWSAEFLWNALRSAR